MSELSYIKGVRTRYRNLLSSEVDVAKDLLKSDYSQNESIVLQVDKCIERLFTYSEKLETQGHTLAKAIGDSDNELLESMWSKFATSQAI